MTIHFRLGYHTLKPHHQVIECWYNDQFIATIYPLLRAIRIVSKSTAQVVVTLDPPTATIITFDQEPPPPPTEAEATEEQP